VANHRLEASVQMGRIRFLLWARTSLTGHVMFFELIFAIPMAALGIFLNYMEGTLTAGWALWVVGLAAVCAIVLAILIWTTITMPRISRGSARNTRKP
jgi:hypothetical protein